eukprot:Tamp_03305.p1 GENE.Tamp_03305~~Tamp_03305.p1  ORF type:complete len:794 (+),score=136.84 Tamp_03305:747-3128(+)
MGFRVNPVVFLVSMISVWAVVITAVAQPDKFFDSATESKRWITAKFTWLFIGAQNTWVLFIAYLFMNPSYRSMKLGPDDSEPDYNAVTWFVMMFGAAGGGTGLIYYGVGEPIFHLGFNRYVGKGYLTYDELSQEAINLTFFHWGIHTWMCYTIVGICMGLVTHRLGLPLTSRSCYFPLFGQIVYGTVGDAIDILSIITTVFAVCASMGVGVIQINAGLSFIAPSIKETVGVQVFLILAMTITAGISAHMGLRRGVRVFSIVSFSVMSAVMIMVLLADDTTYLLNLMVQSFGYHVQHFTALSFHTDAFEQLGIDIDGKSGPKVWMDWWTIFYWGWWVAWSPFVGMFIAKISRGRTVGEIINASLTGPVLYSCIWFAVFGGAGLRMERQAIQDGCLGKCQIVYAGATFDDRLCKVRQKSGQFLGPSSTGLQDQAAADAAEFLKRRPDGCQSIRQLSRRSIEVMWFDVLYRYDNIGGLMVILSLISMILSVITSNDSGSIVLNTICANGWSKGTSKKEQMIMNIQKQFWSLMLGIVTIIMTVVGKSRALTAMQTVIVAVGLPYTILVCVMCFSTQIMFEMELHPGTDASLSVAEGRYDRLMSEDNGMEFWSTSILRVFQSSDIVFSGSLDDTLTRDEIKVYLMSLCAPWYILGVCCYKEQAVEENIDPDPSTLFSAKWRSHAQRKAQMIMFFSAALFYTSFILLITGAFVKNLWVPGLTFYFFFCCLVCITREEVRIMYSVGGGGVRNLAATVFFYPFTLAQMYFQFDHAVPEYDGKSFAASGLPLVVEGDSEEED